MSSIREKMNTLNLINEFKKTFPMENPPSILSDSIQLDKYEREEVDLLLGKTWIEIDCEFLQVNFDVIFYLSPDAFHYYLPGICCAGLRENNKELLVFDFVITMLDRSPVPEYWDDFFLKRWLLFTTQQISVLKNWLLWLSESNIYEEMSINRSIETLTLINENIK